MESTSDRGKIQVSQETADLLMAAGKSHWLKPREELVVAKGKGELKTYWLDPTKKRRHTKTHKDIRVAQDIALNNGSSTNFSGEPSFDDKYARLIDWNVDVLLHHLARVISCRSRSPPRGSLVNHSSEVALVPAAINDVAEVVALPPFDADSSKYRRARPDVSMLQQTRADLHEYVKRIALLYRDVPFHNFEHASHVTLCANKLLNRLINSDEYESEEALHNATYGISSDPLTHFAIVFAALIHDADHTGVPNAQLIKDSHEVAVKFENKSVAEQNSVHLGWELLMDPRFERLRKCIYQTNVERKRFRQLVINSVLATDIADRQVNENRQIKWEKAFKKSPAQDATPLQLQEDMNRKATAVIEHIIQVSDVAHTMQHWHIYRRWNERLFHEMHEAYQTGRVAVDPSTNWYIGELGFFDYYLIPLAMKLKECGVFGASGYEYISYVLKNKKEWERKGRQVVQEMVLLYKDADEDQEESTFDSDYDSDDLEYDSPGDISSAEDDDEGDEDDNDDEEDSEVFDSMQPIRRSALRST
jgi:3'5'-cyclic nucleotide phosphodiesterase/Adenylate and Guanylate cyclase catalytic domain